MSLKIIFVAATLVASGFASQAFAECTQSQEISLAKLTTQAVSSQTSGSQHNKVMRIYDCDAVEGVVSATYVYDYVNADGVQTVSGSVTAQNGHITAIDTPSQERSVAMRKEDYSEKSYGAYPYN